MKLAEGVSSLPVPREPGLAPRADSVEAHFG